MNANNARVILQGFEASRPAPPSATTVTAWKWAAGVHLFPEGICPFCKTVMRSQHIWQVDEKAQRLLKIVAVGNRLRALRLDHPHLRSNGTICMNGYAPKTANATSVAQALFLGIYPQNSMGFGSRRNNTWDRWLKDYFGHPHHDEAGLRKRARPKLLRVGRARATKPKLPAK